MRVVFCIPSTTKNRDEKNKQLEILSSLSIIKEYNNKPDIYIGYDSDDPIYSIKDMRNSIYPELNIKWFEQRVEPGNVVKIWNNLTKIAIDNGYEYIMLIGDDIIYPKNDEWIKLFCNGLKKNDMHGISSGDSGNPNLPMTQFMITKEHYELFGYAFNPQLKNWFCDNYLGELYPEEYINYFEDVKLWNAGGKPRYTPENHQVLYKELLVQDKSKFNKILYNDKNIKNKKITEDFIIDWIDRNNGLCITRNIINFKNQSDYKENKYICITGYDHIINIIFTQVIDFITKPFILIIVETDFFNLTDKMLNTPLLKHVYCWNKPFDHKKISALPIGLNYSRQYDIIDKYISEKVEENDKKLLCINFSPQTNKCRKYLFKRAKKEWKDFCDIFKNIPDLKQYVKKSNIEGQININVTNPLYYHLINKYKFILSPPGAGPDCHRTWEALYIGCIPIVISSSINELYEDLPILVVDKWSDITEKFLNRKYKEITKNKKQGLYNMDKLYMKYWIDKIENDNIDTENYYSQQGEDLFIYRNFINQKCSGIFLELGACDGNLYSNTKFFEDSLNFKGILIEPVKEMYDRLINNRDNGNYYYNNIISESDSEIELLISGNLPVSSVKKNTSTSFHTQWHTNSITRKIKTKKLSSIFTENKIKYIDLFSLDVEGSELDVLKTINWNEIEIYLICIELDGHDKDKDQKCREILIRNGFTYKHKICINEFWINPNYSRINLLYKRKNNELFNGDLKYYGNHINLEPHCQKIIEKSILEYEINPIHFITYGDSKFEKSKQRLLNEAKEFGVFKTIKGYGPKDLSEDFIKKHCDIFKHSRGGGYWIWRPYILRQAINNINDNEYLVYLDAGCTINKSGKKRFYEYIHNLENSQNNYGILSFQMTNTNGKGEIQKEKWWTTGQIFNIFNIKPDSDIGESGQYLGGVLILKKNKHLLEYLDKYEKCIYENPLLITDIYNDKDQHEGFKENRHEQSITSVLRKMHGSEVIEGDETWIVPFGQEESLKYPFWATRIRS